MVNSDLLYHYTSAHGLLGILGAGELWASHSGTLNDTGELAYAFALAREELTLLLDGIEHDFRVVSIVASQFLESVSAPSEGTFIASFSEHGDLLSQWRAYGTSAAGYALGFSKTFLGAIPGFRLVQCIYDESEQRNALRAALDGVLSAPSLPPLSFDHLARSKHPGRIVEQLQLALVTLAPVLKHPAFREEAEWRLVYELNPSTTPEAPVQYRAGRTGVLPYRPIPLQAGHRGYGLKRITIGPALELELERRTILGLLESRGIDGVEVGLSRIPYRSPRG
jgi:hypothetical protein